MTTRRSATPTRERGQATVEFALVLPVLCLILFSVLEFGTAFWRYQQLSAAASEGARRAAVSRTATNRTALIEQSVRTAAPSLDAGSLTITVSSSWEPGDPVTVRVSHPERISVVGIDFFNSSLVSRRTARVEH